MIILTIFCFSKRMPINRMFKYIFINRKNYSHFALREDKPSLSSVVSHSSQLLRSRHVLQFSPPQNFHATREEILSAGKPVCSKIGPIWGIRPLSFILSCATSSTTYAPTFSTDFTAALLPSSAKALVSVTTIPAVFTVSVEMDFKQNDIT